MRDSKKKQDLGKIASKTFSRGLSLVNLTVSSGAKFAGMKLGGVFSSKEEKDKKYADFLSEQAAVLVEELGKLKGSIMKAGQMISVYGEHFLPDEVNKVLKALQSESRPVIWEEMEKVLRNQLGQEKMQQLEVEKKPIAAASMGQVYKAQIKATGECLAIKVQYPGVDQAVDSDLKALKGILKISNLVPTTDSFEDIFKEVRMMLHYEVDYRRELSTILEYKKKLQDDPRFIVPKVYEEYSGRKVLAMSFEEGFGVDSDEVQKLSLKRRNALSVSVLDLMFKEIFVWRMVQTDPHLGNYKIRIDAQGEADKVILLDFGAVRHFSKKYIGSFRELVYSSCSKNFAANIKAGLKLGFLREDDEEHVKELFAKICFLAIEPFDEEYECPSDDGSLIGHNPYDWKNSNLMQRLTAYAKDAVFAFKLRTPPREAIFLDRKMVGTFVFVTVLGLKYGPRRMILKYLDHKIES